MKKINNKGFTLVEGLLIVIALALVTFTGYYIYNSNKNADDNLDTAISSTTKSKTPTSSNTTASAPKLIKYDPYIDIKSPSDVTNLKGAPTDFKKFAGSYVTQLQKNDDGTCGPTFLAISTVYGDLYASGNVGADNCGGAGIMFAKVNGSWQKIFGGQQMIDCDTVNKYKITNKYIDQCFDDSKGPVANQNH